MDFWYFLGCKKGIYQEAGNVSHLGKDGGGGGCGPQNKKLKQKRKKSWRLSTCLLRYIYKCHGRHEVESSSKAAAPVLGASEEFLIKVFGKL